MFKNLLILTIFFGLLAISALAAVSSGDYSSPAHPGKCVITPEIIVEPGMHQHPDDCARIECHEGGHAEIATCGKQIAGVGCKLAEFLNPEADYPECCMRAVICE